MPFDGDFLNLHNDFDNQSINFNMSPNEYIFSPLSLNNNNNNLSTDFFFPNDTLFISNELPSEITIDDIKIFQKTHDDYSTKLYQAFLKFQYDLIEKLIQQFWSLTNIHFSQTNDLTNNGIINVLSRFSLPEGQKLRLNKFLIYFVISNLV
jgi:hypothetical protein